MRHSRDKLGRANPAAENYPVHGNHRLRLCVCDQYDSDEVCLRCAGVWTTYDEHLAMIDNALFEWSQGLRP